MSNPTKQEIYATKTETATFDFNAPSSKVYRRCFITYSVLTGKKQYTVQGF